MYEQKGRAFHASIQINGDSMGNGGDGRVARDVGCWRLFIGDRRAGFGCVYDAGIRVPYPHPRWGTRILGRIHLLELGGLCRIRQAGEQLHVHQPREHLGRSYD